MTAPPFNLDCLTTGEQFRELEPEWNTLLQRTAVDSVFLTWEYLSTWWKHYGDHFRLRVLTARSGDDGRLVGIAPMMTGRGHKFPFSQFRYLTLLGGLGDSLAEFQDFIIEPGWEARLVPAFYGMMTEDLKSEWDILQFDLIDEASPVLPHVLTTVPQFGGHTVQLTSHPSPYLNLPASWDDLLRSKSKNFKKQFKNHWNRLHKNHDVRLLTPGDDLPLDDAARELVRLNDERWKERGQAFQSDTFRNFHRDLMDVFGQRGWLYFRLLQVDHTYAAARYDFVYRNKIWNFQGGWDPDFAHLSLGRLFLGMGIQWAIEHGLTEYDFLKGMSDYKKSWASDVRYLLSIQISNPGSRRALGYQLLRIGKNLVRPRARDFMKPEALAS